ncbi:MAG TPA: thioredoxin family protein [Caulobacterales bacterium]|nr:thioredoxin family protein [Caulobacterales bacterium]
MRVGPFLGVISAAAAMLLCSVAAAEPFRTPHVEIELHAAQSAVAPGAPFQLVLRQKIIPGWHTYWRNPGDSGEATALTWRAPSGFAAPLQWPTPEAIPYTVLVNYGYSGEVLYPIEARAPADAQGSMAFVADVSWLVCSDVCIPEQGQVALMLPVAAASRDDPAWKPRIDAAIAALPRDAGLAAHITAGTPARLSIALAQGSEIRNAHFFPYARGAIDHAAPQAARRGAQGVSFELSPGADQNLGRQPLEGVLGFDVRTADGWERRGYEIRATPGAMLAGVDAEPVASTAAEAHAPAAAAERTAQNPSLLLAIAFAFLGGLVLNVMPCVLPVLSIKALSFAGGAHAGEARRHGLLYLVGVMATCLALAGVLIALRGAGEAAGWGFQLQSPWFVGALALLFFLIGLNLLGAFEIGGAIQNLGSGLAARSGDAGAFFTGALAVVAATPCTAWFMASAIGVAATQPAPFALAVFAALGVGFAAPFTALAFAPGLQRLMPKPGPWMDRVKQFLAFPMFGTAVWLAWVVTGQAGASGALALLAAATLAAFLIWALRATRTWAGRSTAILLAALIGLVVVWIMRPPETAVEAWSAQRVAQLRAEGRPVFVNFTAAWCVTCQVNDRLALSSPRVAEAFARARVAYLEADWTTRNDEIAQALGEHGRAGVPLYLYYRPGAPAPVVLPQVLSESLVLETVSGGSP